MPETKMEAIIDSSNDEITLLTKELRAAERNVEVLANLCDYLSTKVSDFSRVCALTTLHRIEYLRQYYLDPEHPEYGARWVYERPLIWRDKMRFEDDTHRAEDELRKKQDMMQFITNAKIVYDRRLGPREETEAEKKQREHETDQDIEAIGRKFKEVNNVPTLP
jgi:hypothetical protein